MSRPDRPYRATVVGGDVTHHYDYATKEARAHRWLGLTPPILTTVTSRKPVKRGEPVCWVNVYAEGHPASHRTKEFADSAASTATMPRLHCIPVYLPGEGAEPPSNDAYFQQWKDMRTERDAAMARGDRYCDELDAAKAEVERLTRLNENLGFAMTSGNEQLARDTAELSDLRREVDALTKELAAAQAQAMPAGKVVYVAMKLRGAKLAEWDFLTKERREIDCPQSCGWTWFTRVEES